MADVVVAFLWHQHQPYYPDDVTGENPMPWVRLHGVKDYYGMALHLLEFPEMRCTINLVPSLLLQLESYAQHGASDRFLDLSRIPADGLTENDALFLLDHFFMGNAEHMIRPYPRYGELFQRRGADKHSARDALRRFQERDLRDLQVWFNLTWIHPLAVERDEFLSGLRDKGRNFTESEKSALLEKHLAILKEVLPLHRRLADSGQIELTTTPYFHPILPLLLDKKLAREALPDLKLPHYTGGYPEDAAWHLRRAIEQHASLFGKPPRGLWPAEGSVCQSMLPLLAQHGIRWIATDEEILGASTHGFVSRDSKGHVRNPDRMYRPYKVKEGTAELDIVFRDHALSDLIGFHYQRSDPNQAAANFLTSLRGIGQCVHTAEPALVSVILDGENCWEHYPGGGVAFLRCPLPGVYPDDQHQTDADRRLPPEVPAARCAAASVSPAAGSTTTLPSGSATRRTIPPGTPCIGRASTCARYPHRQPLAGNDQRNGAMQYPPDAVEEKAWEELYIAEGSDWFWWYGDEHTSAQDSLFDYLFRKHLQNVYLLLGDVPPPELARPIAGAASGSATLSPGRSWKSASTGATPSLNGWRQGTTPATMNGARWPWRCVAHSRTSISASTWTGSFSGSIAMSRPGPPWTSTTPCASSSWSRPAAGNCGSSGPERPSKRWNGARMARRLSRCRPGWPLAWIRSWSWPCRSTPWE